MNPDTMFFPQAFLFDFFATPKQDTPRKNGCFSADEHPEHVGSGYVLPEQFKSTEGRVKKPIISKRFQPVGQFCIDYLVIRPMAETKCSLKRSFAKHWKPNWKGLDVAHRGLGNSYTMAQHCSNVRENTIASLKDAVAHGADMVEFDVQVSKDLVPVIFHEFELCTSIVKKNGDHQMVQMPLKNLTLDQLQHLKTNHPWEKSSSQIKSFSEDQDHQPFPTLERAMNTLDCRVGFNIELKWDMEMMDGSRESHNAFELNLFVDTILKTVLEHGRSRKIVFSSFNPDICTVLRYKQNKYPVLFLTAGINTKYDKYLDSRTHTIADASNFVATSSILGVNIIAEDIQRDPTQIELVKKRGQVIFCWTDDQNDPVTVRNLKTLGIDGIIYDRIDVNKNKEELKEQSFLLEHFHEEEEDIQEKNCSCSPPRASGTPRLPEIYDSRKISASDENDSSGGESPSRTSFSGLFAGSEPAITT